MRTMHNLLFPLEGECFIFWGGDTKKQNYHVSSRAQRGAFDIVAVNAKGKWFESDGKTNEDCCVFGRRVLCPLDGVAVEAIDGVHDNMPHVVNPYSALGNCVIIRHDERLYSILAHLRHGCVYARAGHRVRRGQIIGLCGNSGHSTAPHLHFHMQSSRDLGMAAGIKCFFERIMVNGGITQDYSPVKGERVVDASAHACAGELLIRPFAPGEERAVMRLWRVCGLTVPSSDPRGDIARKTAFQPQLFLVGELNGRVVATVMAGYDGRRGWLNWVAVSPAVRTRGFGSRIVESAIGLLGDMGCTKVNLNVRKTNLGVVAFYERLGFHDDNVICMGRKLGRRVVGDR